jgi:hypothetical protein
MQRTVSSLLALCRLFNGAVSVEGVAVVVFVHVINVFDPSELDLRGLWRSHFCHLKFVLAVL